LARRMIETFVAEIPLYSQLPREQLEGEILDITEANLRLFFGVLRTGEPIGADDLAEVRLSAARRAEERVPLDAVLTAYHVGARRRRGDGGGAAGTAGGGGARRVGWSADRHVAGSVWRSGLSAGHGRGGECAGRPPARPRGRGRESSRGAGPDRRRGRDRRAGRAAGGGAGTRHRPAGPHPRQAARRLSAPRRAA